MITVDPRVGSGDLVPLLEARGVPTQVGQLEFGDAAWLGNGPDGPLTASVGVERKTLGDLLNCITDQRFSGHQLPGLLAAYQWVYLVVEGTYYGDKAGTLCQWGRPVTRYGGLTNWTLEKVEHWLSTMRNKRGLIVLHTRDPKETARYLALEYTWWTAKEWDEHSADLGVYIGEKGRMSVGRTVARSRMTAAPQISTLSGWWAFCLDAVGFEYAMAAQERWPSAFLLANATVEEWAELKPRKGPKLGTKRAALVVKAIRGGA